MIKEVSQTSSFEELTKFLVFSFDANDYKVVEDILVKREKGLLDEVQKMKICCLNLEQERDDMQKFMKMELEISKEFYEKELKKEYEKEVKKELDIMQKNMKIKFEFLAKEKYENELKQELDTIRKNMSMELELGKEKYKKELEQGRDLSEKNLKMEFELSRKNYEKELEFEKELFEKNVRVELELELELSKENHERELRGKQDLFEAKLSLLERGNSQLVKALRNDFEKKILVFENKLSLAAMEKMELEELRKALEKKIEEFENKLSLAAKEKKELEEHTKMLERVVSLAAVEKTELQEKLKRELAEKIEALEGENRDIEKKRKLLSERLENKSALVRERLAMLKGFFDNVISGIEEAYRDSENDSCERVISMSDSHNQASDLKSCRTKTQASLANPSSKTPQLEIKDLEGITNGDQLGVKTGGSFLEYEPEAGGYSANSINCRRKRSVDGREDDSDSLGDHKKTKHLIESGSKTVPLPINLKNFNPASPGTSKANPPSKFCSASIMRHDYKNRRHENSELQYTKSISGVVDGTNRFSRGDPHLLIPLNKVVTEFKSGKVIKWGHRAEMISAFENDPELCMAAVCALYRRSISARVSGNRGGFSSFDTVSGTSAAKYLINSDPANKLSKSVSEVQQDRPAILKTCKRLAIHYGDQLFEIYQKNLDPFFCSKP